MDKTETPRRLRSVAASLCVAVVLVGGALGGLSAGAPIAAAATGHAKHAAQRIGPLPKVLRSLPGASHVLYDYTSHRAVGWWQKAAPCPGPKGRTLRPKSITKTSVLGGEMRGWCPLHAGDVLLYVPNADVLTRTNPNFTVGAGTVVHDGGLAAGTKVSYISTGARSFKVTSAVATALREAYTTMQQYDFGAWQLAFASSPSGAPVIAPAAIPKRLAREYVDPKSPYYGQVAKRGAWYCTIPRSARRLVAALSGATTAGVIGLFATPTAPTPCLASHHYYAPSSALSPRYATVQVTPLRGYRTTAAVAGFFVEANRKLTNVYRVWAPFGAEAAFGAPWIKGPAHWVHAFTSGWAELRPSHATATDPRTMQIWQPLVGVAAWPSGFLVGGPPRLPAALCSSPSTAPVIVLSTGGAAVAPAALAMSGVAPQDALCH